MDLVKFTSLSLTVALMGGCASDLPPSGPQGPELVTSGRSTESGQYGEVGLRFTTWGDFVALASPTRWKSPIATGGSLSWLNPSAWSEDAGRTGRIFLGEAVVVGGAAAAAGASGGSGGSSGSDLGSGSGSGASGPTPPLGGGGGDIPPAPAG